MKGLTNMKKNLQIWIDSSLHVITAIKVASYAARIPSLSYAQSALNLTFSIYLQAMWDYL